MIIPILALLVFVVRLLERHLQRNCIKNQKSAMPSLAIWSMGELFRQQQTRVLKWWFSYVLHVSSPGSETSAPEAETFPDALSSKDRRTPNLKVVEIMNATAPLPKEIQVPEPRPHEPSIEEILASIRRIIADGEALAGKDGGPQEDGARPDLNGEAIEPAARAAPRGFTSPAADSPVRAAFNTLLASRFAQHGDAVIALTREMLRPMLKAWLDDHLPAIVERLVSAEIERVARGE
jgi:hypothetical protein